MITLNFRNAVPRDTIRIRISSGSGAVKFTPGPFIGRTFADRSDGAPVIEFLTVDGGEVDIVLSPSSRRRNTGPVDFELRVGIEGEPDLSTVTLTAEAFEGTAIEATLPGLAPRSVPLGGTPTVLPFTLRSSELVAV